jgi:purine-binding chemotaxis protein CheW
MADARKRARQGRGAVTPPPEPPAETLAEKPAADTAPPEPPPPAVSSFVIADEDTTPAAEPAASTERAAPAARIALPASGLAADILARVDAAALAPAAPAAPAAPVIPEEPAPAAAPAASHNLSFFSVPAQEERKAAETMEHLATFVLDREEYAVDVHVVQEIRRVTEITAVPRAPDFIRGVINLRGRILPVVDLKRKLRMGQVEIGKASRIVVVRLRERLLGLLVDGAQQVLKVPLSRIEPPPEEVLAGGGDYIRGVAKLDDRLVILVDLLRILAQELREGPASPASS